MSLFCRHDWEVLDKETLPSGFEQMHRAGIYEVEGAPVSLFRKTHVVTLACKKCGKVRTERTSNQ